MLDFTNQRSIGPNEEQLMASVTLSSKLRNLYGLDIDPRAAQLAGFALMMKAREDDRRVLERGGCAQCDGV